MEEQQTSNYINRLKYSIQKRVVLQDVFYVNEAQNKGMKIKRLQGRSYLSKEQQRVHPTIQELCKVPHQVSDLHPVRRLIPLHPGDGNSPHYKGQREPYAKLGVGKCYMCDKLGYRSNESPKRRPSIWQTKRMMKY